MKHNICCAFKPLVLISIRQNHSNMYDSKEEKRKEKRRGEEREEKLKENRCEINLRLWWANAVGH